MAARCIHEGCRYQQSYGEYCKQHRDPSVPAKKRGRKPGQVYEEFPPRVRCALHRRPIPIEMPRYQWIRFEGGGRGLRDKRKVISTVCEPCWLARSSRSEIK